MNMKVLKSKQMKLTRTREGKSSSYFDAFPVGGMVVFDFGGVLLIKEPLEPLEEGLFPVVPFPFCNECAEGEEAVEEEEDGVVGVGFEGDTAGRFFVTRTGEETERESFDGEAEGDLIVGSFRDEDEGDLEEEEVDVFEEGFGEGVEEEEEDEGDVLVVMVILERDGEEAFLLGSVPLGSVRSLR
jgi:hypothetical protein